MDERGASAVEYGLLITGIAALIVVVVFAFGGVVSNIFSTTCNSVGQSGGGPADPAWSPAPARPSGPRPRHVRPGSHAGSIRGHDADVRTPSASH